MKPAARPQEAQALAASSGPELTVITPAYNESANLPLMHERLKSALDPVARWEWIIVDDHSGDATYDVATDLSKKDARVRCVRFSRNFGSHRAILCGLERMKGECAVIMASDLQDPPEIVPQLLDKWKEGVRVVWAVRSKREGVGFWSLLLSRIYNFLMRRFVGLRNMPAEGADFLLLDRRVTEALKLFPEKNFSVFAMITWMGFPQEGVLYDKKARLHGKSGWSLEKKLKLAIDSMISFSYLPMRMISVFGLASMLSGLVWLAYLLLEGPDPGDGWTKLASALLIVSGLQWMMMGVLGEYLWRALDEARRRPRFIVEKSTEEEA